MRNVLVIILKFTVLSNKPLFYVISMSKINVAEIMSQKFALELNGALAMENAGMERLRTRIDETLLPDAKQQMQHHLQESLVHQQRLQQLITNLGGKPTEEKMGLPIPKYPQSMAEMMKNTMTKQEWELKRSEEDLINESAETICYQMLIQKAQMAGGVFQNAIEPLSLNMKDEAKMADWIKTNSPGMMAQLWPQIQSAIASASSPSSSLPPPNPRIKMKSLVWHGPMDVRIDDKPQPTIQHPEDIVLRITSTAICGSDLHLYHGTVPGMQPGQTLGHEFMGIVEEAGPHVTEVKVGDKLVIPFNIACGQCHWCRNNYWSQCDRANPKSGDIGAAFGYTQLLGGYDGGQAEYVGSHLQTQTRR